MRKFKPAFLLMAMLVGTCFAADGVVASRAIPNNLTNSRATVGDENVARTTNSRTTTNRTTVSRATPNSATSTRVDARGDASSRTTTSRSIVSRGGDSVSRATTQNRSTVARTSTTNASRGTSSRTAVATPKNATVTRESVSGARSSSNTRRATTSSRNGAVGNAGRAGVVVSTRGQNTSMVSVNPLSVSGRMANAKLTTTQQVAETREQLERSAELHTSCQIQYNECMDQFCAVLDENQKRCSCSSNLSRYSKSEKAVTQATEQLNEVAQAIRYVGLSADEIRAILSETEAEEAMRDTKDNSVTHNMLQQIEEMIKDPTSRTNNYVSEMEFGLDMDLSFSFDPLDIFNLDFLHLGSNSSSISNVRGAELYRTAKKRCSAILNQCADAGATQDQIIGNYDMAIDRDCIAYEANLTQRNETLLANVRSANLILQKARLVVMQNKNQYDALGCVAALENCMTDDMVCGEDYLQCIDPTKTYIDADGAVIMGQDITVIQSFMSEYNNAVMDVEFLKDSYNTKIDPKTCRGDGKCVVKYLLQKIGTQQKTTDEGLCRAVLDRCQLYTYDKNKKYRPYNDIVVNYLQRAMANIKSAQQRIISDYASNCVTDVSGCYSQQVAQLSSLSSYANKSDVYSIMRGACRSIALTCGLAIFTGKPEIETNLPLTVGENTYSVSDCKYVVDENYNGGNVPVYGTSKYNDAIINCISDMFYASLLNNVGTGGTVNVDEDGCATGYTLSNGKCTPITYNISYDVAGGEHGAEHPESVTYDQQFMVSPPTKSGFVFKGWNIANMDGNAHKIGGALEYVRSISTSAQVFKNLTANDGGTVTFTAQWRDVNELTHAIPDPACTGLIPRVEGGCVVNGYRCETGYETTIDGNCKYIPVNTNTNNGNGSNNNGNTSGGGNNNGGNGDNTGGNTGDNSGGNGGDNSGGGTPSGSGDTPVTPTSYNVTYDCNGGTGGGTETVTSGTTIQSAGKSCTRESCQLTGWSPALPYTVNSVVTFAAQWNCQNTDNPSVTPTTKYTLSYRCGNYGGTPPADQQVAAGDSFSFADSSCNSPSSDYGFFMGWQFEGDNKLYLPGWYGRKYTWNWNTNQTVTPKYSVRADSSCTDVQEGQSGGCVANGFRCEDGFSVKNFGGSYGYWCVGECSGGIASMADGCLSHAVVAADNMAGACASYGCMCDNNKIITYNAETGGGRCSNPPACNYEGGAWICIGPKTSAYDTNFTISAQCVDANCVCPNEHIFDGNTCVKPCTDIENSAVDLRGCITGTEDGCVAQYCKCANNYELNTESKTCVRQQVNVVYDCGNNYGGTIDAGNHDKGSKYTLLNMTELYDLVGSDNICKRSGYKVTQWKVGNTNRNFGYKVTLNYENSVTFTAVWTRVTCDTENGQVSDTENECVTDTAGSGLGACIKTGCRCAENKIPSSDGTQCVDPCSDFANTTPSSTCITGNEDGCVAQYCECADGYNKSGNSCVGIATYTIAYQCSDGSAALDMAGASIQSQSVHQGDVFTPMLAYDCANEEAHDQTRFFYWECQPDNDNNKSLWQYIGHLRKFMYVNNDDNWGNEVNTYRWEDNLTCTAYWTNDRDTFTCDTTKNMKENNSCQKLAYTSGDAAWKALNGCIDYQCSCDNDTIPVNNDGIKTCVNPCGELENATASNECTAANSDVCIAQYCKCDTGYHVDNGACVSD